MGMIQTGLLEVCYKGTIPLRRFEVSRHHSPLRDHKKGGRHATARYGPLVDAETSPPESGPLRSILSTASPAGGLRPSDDVQRVRTHDLPVAPVTYTNPHQPRRRS